MHIFFSGIGGAGIGPLALVAHEAGYQVSGSDKQHSDYIGYLKEAGIEDIYVGQTAEAIAALNDKSPIDWFVYSSALPLENPDAPELLFAKEKGIKSSKRDEFLNQILKEKNLQLLAVAGTHGKTTTTAMLVWLFKELSEPVSYILPAKTTYAKLGSYDLSSNYFIYEADEFDRNFLSFTPRLSLISGVSWDHHEIFPTRDAYKQAFTDFISASNSSYLWEKDADYLRVREDTESGIKILDPLSIVGIDLVGTYNRQDAWLAVCAAQEILKLPQEELIGIMNRFPGLSRRMEEIVPNLFSDYAHTPEKIVGAMSVALEKTKLTNQKVVVVYEPLTNRRQHFMIDDYKDCFKGAEHVYWLPSYLAREDPDQLIISPAELIDHLSDPSIASPMDRSDELKQRIQEHLTNGEMVIGMAGGGGDSLDDWLRREFKA